MVSSISSFSAAGYLNSVKGLAPVEPATPATPATTQAASGITSTTDPLQPANAVTLPSSLLSLLQSVSSTSDNGGTVSDLVGSSASFGSDNLSGLYATLAYSKSSITPLQQALFAQKSGNSSSVQQVLNGYNSYQNAFNNSLIQNAQALLDTGKSLIA